MADLKWNKAFAEEQAGGDADLLRELLKLLVESSTADLEKVRQGAAVGNATAVADAAHSIKGAAASLGVEGLREESYRIEKIGLGNDLSGLDLVDLEDLVHQLAGLAA